MQTQSTVGPSTTDHLLLVDLKINNKYFIDNNEVSTHLCVIQILTGPDKTMLYYTRLTGLELYKGYAVRPRLAYTV